MIRRPNLPFPLFDVPFVVDSVLRNKRGENKINHNLTFEIRDKLCLLLCVVVFVDVLFIDVKKFAECVVDEPFAITGDFSLVRFDDEAFVAPFFKDVRVRRFFDSITLVVR